MCNARIAADDQGRAIAALLKHPEAHIGMTIDLSGPVEMDHEQMTAELSEARGRVCARSHRSAQRRLARRRRRILR